MTAPDQHSEYEIQPGHIDAGLCLNGAQRQYEGVVTRHHQYAKAPEGRGRE